MTPLETVVGMTGTHPHGDLLPFLGNLGTTDRAMWLVLANDLQGLGSKHRWDSPIAPSAWWSWTLNQMVVHSQHSLCWWITTWGKPSLESLLDVNFEETITQMPVVCLLPQHGLDYLDKQKKTWFALIVHLPTTSSGKFLWADGP